MTRYTRAGHAPRMTSRTSALCLLLASSACGPGGGGETGSSGSASSGSASSSSGVTPTTSAGSSTTDATGTATSSAGTGTSGSTSTSSTSGSTGTTGEPLTGSGTASTGSSSSGGGGDACVDVSGDYGPCEAIIGYGFDGSTCRAFSGCNCAPHCDDFAPDPVACALGCAAAGECNAAALHPAGINKEPVVQGSFCDELDACTTDPEYTAWLTQIFGAFDCQPNQFCGPLQACHVAWQGELDAALWPKVCAASLLPGADLKCVVFGP